MANKVSHSKKAFYAAFVELVRELPLEKISATAIIESAQYSKGAFYKNFGSRDEFLKAIVDDEIRKYVDISRDTYKEAGYTINVAEKIPSKSVIRLFEYVYQNRDLYRFIFSNYNYFNTVDYFFKETRAISPCYNVEFADDFPDMENEIYVYLSMYVQKACIKYWIEHDFEKSPEYMATQCSLFQRKSVKKITLCASKNKEE